MQYDAVTVDTNIFTNNGYHLEAGLLAQLVQFREGAAQFVLTEVVYREVRKHMLANSKTAQDVFTNALRKAVEQGVAPAEAEALLEKLPTSPSPKDAVDARLKKFLRDCGGEIIRAEAADMRDLVRMYFSPEAPFERSGKKKEEFPDAIALLSLQAWAKDNGKKVLAISDDKGWEAFAKDSEFIDVEKDFGRALEILQNDAESASEIVQSLISDVANGKAEGIEAQIRENLDAALASVDFVPEASSFLHAEGEAGGLGLKGYEFIQDDDGYEVTVVRVGKNSIVARVEADVSVVATADFSLSVWDGVDKEYVGISGVTAETDASFEASLLITFEGDFEHEEDEIEVVDVEVVSAPSAIDFGHIEPDMGEEEEPDYDDLAGNQ